MQTGQNSKKLNNKGFSLVELIVVISIMIVLVAVVGISFNAVSNANCGKVSYNISQGLARTQQLCMSKQSGFVSIYLDGDNNWVMEIEGPSVKDKHKEIIGTNAIDVFYTVGGTETQLTSGSKLTMSFTQSGSCRNVVTNLTSTAKGTTPETYEYTPTYGSGAVSKITVKNSLGRSSEITIHPNTGHFERN